MAAKGQNWLQKKPRAQISQSLVNKIMVKTLTQHFPRRERRSGGRGARPGVGAAPGAVEAGARCRDVCRLDSAEPSSVRGQTVPRSRGRSWRPSGERLGERRRVRDSDAHAQWVCVVITRSLLTPPPTPMPPAGSVDEMARGPGVWMAVGRPAALRLPAARLGSSRGRRVRSGVHLRGTETPRTPSAAVPVRASRAGRPRGHRPASARSVLVARGCPRHAVGVRTGVSLPAFPPCPSGADGL